MLWSPQYFCPTHTAALPPGNRKRWPGSEDLGIGQHGSCWCPGAKAASYRHHGTVMTQYTNVPDIGIKMFIIWSEQTHQNDLNFEEMYIQTFND